MAETLKGLEVKEVERIIFNTKTLKDAAKEIGVAYQTLLQFRSENMKEFKKIKAEREQGLIIDDEPIIKTKPTEEKESKTSSEISVVETIEKSKYDELEAKYNTLKEQYDVLDKEKYEMNILEAGLRQETEVEKNEKLKVKAENERLRDQIERLKKNKAEAEEQQKKSTSELNERSRKAENLMRAAETRVAQLQKQVDEQNEIIKKKNETIQFNVSNALKIEEVQTQLEQERAEEVERYEQSLKQLEQEVQQLGVERDEWKGKYLDLDNAYKALEEESKTNVTVINPPQHYAPSGTGTDVIGFLENQFSYEAYKGFMVGNIIKYATRTGRKDEEIQELRKINDYANRMIQHLQQSDVVDAG